MCVCVKIVRTGQILAKIKNVNDVIYFDTWNLPLTLPMLYSVTLTYISRSNISNVKNISKTVRDNAKLQEMTL